MICFNFYKKLFLAVLTVCFLNVSIWAQTKVSGIILDADNNEPIIGANILIQETGSGTITDFDGYYELSLDPGQYNLIISYIGYRNHEQALEVGSADQTLDIRLGTDELALDEVVVTGTFSSRSQQESPISMSYLGGDKIQKLNANSQADVLRAIPGITAEGGGGEVASNVFVRGLPSGGQYQFTPLQVDGLPTISAFGLNSSAHDVYFRNDIGIRNLEFVRGGSSILFGAGSVAGIVNYSSVTGTANQNNKVKLEWAERGRAKIDFLTAGPLSGDDVYYAFSGMYRYDEGPIQTGLPTKGTQLRGNIKKLYDEGKSSITFSTQYIDDNVQFFLPYPLNGDRSRPTGNNGDEIFTLQTSAVRHTGFETVNGPYESPISNGVSTKGGYAMIDLKHSFGNDLKLSAKAKYAQYEHWFNLFLDGDGRNSNDDPTANLPIDQSKYNEVWGLPSNTTYTSTATGQVIGSNDLLFRNRVLDRYRPMEEIAGEFNLTKTLYGSNSTHNITLGTYVANTTAGDDNWLWSYVSEFNDEPGTVEISYTAEDGELINHTSGGYVNGSGRQTSNNEISSTKAAVYIADQIEADQWVFDFGLRYEYAKGDISKETGVGSNTFNRGTVDASDFAVAIAALYKLNADLNVYANYSSGYFFPELRGVRFAAPGLTQTYETERINQAEIGAKYGKGNLSATGAIYYNTLKDRRNVSLVNDGNGGVIEEVNNIDTRTFGLEVNLNYSITSALSAFASGTFQSHEYTKFEGEPIGADGVQLEYEGNELQRQPNTLFIIGLNYDNNGFDAGFSYNYYGDKFTSANNAITLDAYNISRLDAGYTFKIGDNSETLRLGVGIFNLFDEEGITEGSPRQGNSQTDVAQYFTGRPILPRRISVTALFDF